MKVAVFAGIVLFGFFSFAGEWSKDDAATVRFTGPIEADEYERFRVVFDGQVRKLIVNSGGGETMAALKIASVLHSASIEISVEGFCLSSCANYFFTAAAKRVIRKGLVGYHGNMKACFSGDRWETAKQEMLRSGVPLEQIEAYEPVLLRNMKVEEDFLKLVGVSQELFEISCTPDKGVGDGKSYSFLLPSPKTFERFGLRGVIGTQDPELIQKLPVPPTLW